MNRERRDLAAFAQAREQIECRSMPHEAQRARDVLSRRALPRRVVRQLAATPARDRVDKIIDQILLRTVVDVSTRVRNHHAAIARLSTAVVPWTQEATDLRDDRLEVLVDRPSPPAPQVPPGAAVVIGEKLRRPERDRLESPDLLIDPVRLLLLAGALLDDREVTFERREISLDGRLADADLLGELLDRVRLGRVGEQTKQRPLADELLRVRSTFGCGRHTTIVAVDRVVDGGATNQLRQVEETVKTQYQVGCCVKRWQPGRSSRGTHLRLDS